MSQVLKFQHYVHKRKSKLTIKNAWCGKIFKIRTHGVINCLIIKKLQKHLLAALLLEIIIHSNKCAACKFLSKLLQYHLFH